jgi:hypothetical protein
MQPEFYPTNFMPDSVFVPGMATAIGSLPHRDADAAAALVLRCVPELPAAPQLPNRTPLEGVVAQWARAIDGVHVEADGAITLRSDLNGRAAIDTTFDSLAHGGLLAFLDAAAAAPVPVKRVKVQCAGPLTLGVALVRAGVDVDAAFEIGSRAARAWACALQELVATSLPEAAVLVCFDEPGLVRWSNDHAPGSLRVALDAGPRLVHFDVGALDLDDAAPLSRFLDGGGWVIWGAIPTHRPVGEHVAPLWKSLLDTWCELTRRGCDPARLRSQALVAPACGLAGHGVSQAERAMVLAREIGGRVHDHGAATKLAIGA